MLNFIAERFYLIPLLAALFMYLYYMGGEDIIFFRKKRYEEEPKSQERLMSALTRFARPRSFKTFGKTTIEFNGEKQTYDAILLSFYGTIAFKANPKGGDIYGDSNKDVWTQVFKGEKKNFPSPLDDVRGASRFFREIYRKENVKFGQVEGMVVFTNREVAVAVPKSAPACKADKLNEMLQGKKYIADNGADIEAMKAALEKYIVAE